MKITSILTKNPIFHTKPETSHARMSLASMDMRDELNKLIEEKKLAFEEVPCLCGNESFSLIAEYDKFGIAQKTVICEKCGLIQSNPRMSDEALDWFYGSDFYGNLYGRIERKATTEFILSEAEGRPKKRYEFIKKYIDYGKVKSVLEIGCGGGWSLYQFFKDGKKVVGYDYGPALVEAGVKLGMDLRVGKIEDDPKEHGEYDVILMCHVFEHLPHPLKFMKKLETYLAPGGLIYIEVPHMKEVMMASLVNAHTYSFTKNTLLHYLDLAGFAPVAYWSDKNPIGSQAVLLKRTEDSYQIPSLEPEYERMKIVIEKSDAKWTRRQSYKKILKNLGLLRATSFFSHLKRKMQRGKSKA